MFDLNRFFDYSLLLLTNINWYVHIWITSKGLVEYYVGIHRCCIRKKYYDQLSEPFLRFSQKRTITWHSVYSWSMDNFLSNSIMIWGFWIEPHPKFRKFIIQFHAKKHLVFSVCCQFLFLGFQHRLENIVILIIKQNVSQLKTCIIVIH